MRLTVRCLAFLTRCRCGLTVCCAAVLGLWFLGGSAQALDITTCSQTVPAGDTGNLTGDLDCPSLTGAAAVILEQRAVLAMNGFTIRAGGFPLWAVSCDDRCTVQGPGEVIGGAIVAQRGLTLTDVDIHDIPQGTVGVQAFAGPGLLHPGSLRLTNVTVTDVGGDCVVGGKVTANNVTVTRCATIGLSGIRSVRGTTVTATDNGWSGVLSRRVVLDGLVAHGNGVSSLLGVHSYGAGVQASRGARLLNSVVTGNKFLGVDLDILTARPPVLTATTCDHSGRGNEFSRVPVPSWGVCSLD